MKKCVLPVTFRMVVALTILFCGAGAVFSFREFICGHEPPLVFFVMGVFLGGISLYQLYRMISKGGWGFFYDEEKIIFVLSRNDRREFRWEELKALQTGLAYPTPAAPSVSFYVPDPSGKKKRKRISITPHMEGCGELAATLRRKGFPAAAPFDAAALDMKKVYHDIFDGQLDQNNRRQK